MSRRGYRGGGRWRGRERSVAGLLCVAVLLAGCDDADESAPDDAPEAADASDPDADDAGTAADDEPALPEVTTIDPDEVEGDADPDTLDGRIASAAADLPVGWEATVVADRTLGPYVVGLPEGATVWRVGDDLGPLLDAVEDDAWGSYWEPILSEAGGAVETSSMRSVVVLPADDAGVELHLTITATPRSDVPVEDPAAVAEAFADSFRDQQLTVEEVTTETAGEREVGAVTMATPDDEFEDGVPRRLVQWFHPEPDGPVLWSVTCDGPVPDAATVDERCPTALASFRTPPR